jgi:uncharacterized protein (TIGR03118 family)
VKASPLKIAALAGIPLGLFLSSSAHAEMDVRQTNLVSDIPGLAKFTDPNLVNPWGISESSGSPFWVSNNGSDTSTLYNTAGKPQGLIVAIPSGAPTGQVFNASSAFNNDKFIFAGEDGTITGWRGALGTTAETLFGPASSSTEFKGLAIGSVSTNTYLYAADFGTDKIDVFPSAAAPALTGNFTDPNIPSGYAPFNIQNLNGNLYVTYALVGPTGDDVAGLGNGFVDEFDLQGNLIRRVASQGWLNSPWGLAIAPNSFGNIGGDLLVGNFGDGRINVFNPAGAFLEQLTMSNGDAVSVDGLWGLQFGNGGAGGALDTLYFTAGLDDESHGLFGSFTAVPEPSTVYGGIALVVGAGFVMLRRRTRQAKAV